MKKTLKSILIKISKVISKMIMIVMGVRYFLTPIEYRYKKSLLEKKLEEILIEETICHFKEHFKRSVLFLHKDDIRDYAITKSIVKGSNNLNLEFGVFKGESANFFSKYVENLYVFDSFEGLNEDWVGEVNRPVGYFNLGKKLPKLKSNVEPIVGVIQNTLENFLTKHNKKINFVHLDVDTYDSTKFILVSIKPYLSKNAILLFDNFFGYVGWENGEYKALNEIFKKNEFEYKAFMIRNAQQCVVQIK